MRRDRGSSSTKGPAARRSPRPLTRLTVAGAVLAGWLASGMAAAERRPPFGNDAAMLEARVREDIERRIAPLLQEMAPGQAELKYVDVRVTRPTALPAGAAPGFEDLAPATEFVAERAEVSLVLDSKLPPQFRKDLKNLIKNRLEGLTVPVDLHETMIAFPTPRQLPPGPRELPYGYPAPPPQPQAQPATAAAPPPAPTAPPPAPADPPPSAGVPWPLAVVLSILGVLVGALAVALATVLAGRRARRAEPMDKPAAADAARPEARGTNGAGAAIDHLPEVRRALREDRVLARRVMGELLRENQLDKVAVAVELVGPIVVEDLRRDPSCAIPLRDAAALLVDGRVQGDTSAIVSQLHRRILKHRMVGTEDPVEQEFAFLLGLSPARLAAVLVPETPAVQAAALRYVPAHLRAAYLEERSASERTALAAALAAPRGMTKEHLLDVATTLRARATELAHLDSGETADVDLAVELVEERPAREQAEILEAMRRADPAKARLVQAALIREASFEQVPDDVLAAAATAVPTEVLARFLRETSETVATRILQSLPGPVAEAIREDLSLEVAPTPLETADARRAMFASLRKALRDRGLTAPLPVGSENDKGKVVAI